MKIRSDCVGVFGYFSSTFTIVYKFEESRVRVEGKLGTD